MASCPRVTACPLFEQFLLKSPLKVWQAFYCEGAFANCERWRLASAHREVPPRLLPNGRLLAVPLDQLEARHMS